MVFGRLRESLARTKAHLMDRLGARDAPADPVQRPESRGIAVESLDALEEALLVADVGVAATNRIVGAVGARTREGALGPLVREEMLRIFEAAGEPPAATAVPHVVMLVGVNGTGKTTTVAKLAHLYKEEGRRPLICAADTFRAAAVEQIAVWAERAGVPIVRAGAGADPAAVVFDAISSAKARGCDVVLIDTAGRLHTRVNLMNELVKVRRVAGRASEGAPHEVLLVLDATVGQNGFVQAREFLQAAGVTGVVLTKLDGTAKGGVAVAIAQDLGLPVRYVGVGEGLGDLVAFAPEEYVDALFEATW